MTTPTGQNKTYGRIGIKEDVHDIIYDISPTDTPAMQMAKRLTARNSLHQWQTDSLAAAAANNAVEGADASFSSAAATTMLGNYTAISTKTISVSRTLDTVAKYGRATEMGYLVAKYGKELKRDIELMLVGSQGSAAATASTARYTAGWRAMIQNYARCTGTTVTAGTVYPYSSGWTASSDSTASTMLEADLKNALELAWTDGGSTDTILVNSKQKKRLSSFGGATAFEGFSASNGRGAQGVVIGGVDLYVSDYGAHKVVMDRFLGQTAVLCLDSEYTGIAWLDTIKVEDLAKVGDGRRKQIVCEWAAVLQNPDAHAQLIGCKAT